MRALYLSFFNCVTHHSLPYKPYMAREVKRRQRRLLVESKHVLSGLQHIGVQLPDLLPCMGSSCNIYKNTSHRLSMVSYDALSLSSLISTQTIGKISLTFTLPTYCDQHTWCGPCIRFATSTPPPHNHLHSHINLMHLLCIDLEALGPNTRSNVYQGTTNLPGVPACPFRA